VRELIEAGDATARRILERRRADLEAGVALLLARETVTADEFLPLRPGPTRIESKPVTGSSSPVFVGKAS
jgi:cell division protease FtsH